MNKLVRILIVGLNIGLVPITFPIGVVKVTMLYILDKEEFNDVDIYYKQTWKLFLGGFIAALKANIVFLKEGDISVFDDDKMLEKF